MLVGNEGFIIVVTTTGKIVYISRQIEQHLGHAQVSTDWSANILFTKVSKYILRFDEQSTTKKLTLIPVFFIQLLYELVSAVWKVEESHFQTGSGGFPLWRHFR